MNLEQRMALLQKLREYLASNEPGWEQVKEKSFHENAWFIPEFINFQVNHITNEYLDPAKLNSWISRYQVPSDTRNPRKVGIVMAGNIPFAGFHDLLAGLVSGHRLMIKPSSKDYQLINGVVQKLREWAPDLSDDLVVASQLKGCDAYIATGSNNSSRYFDYYFSKYPHIIRRNRTSIAVLTGNETLADLELLADDVYLYFGLGCRNVTKLYVPENYDFLPLLESLKKYNWVFDEHKYKNNYDYQLAIMIINKLYYMSNGSLLVTENKSLFSPISQLHYEYYKTPGDLTEVTTNNPDIQCVVGKDYLPFGKAQTPVLDDYADKADTLQFLLSLR